jgi:hypothetical protein
MNLSSYLPTGKTHQKVVSTNHKKPISQASHIVCGRERENEGETYREFRLGFQDRLEALANDRHCFSNHHYQHLR